MRRTTVLALLAAAAVAGWIALFEREEGARDEGQPVFGFDEAAIQAVEITRPGEPTVRLARDGDEFVVAEGDGPESAADSGEADLFLQNVASLRFEREIEGVAEADLAGFGLDPSGLADAGVPGVRRPIPSPPDSGTRPRRPETATSSSASGCW